MTVKKLKQLIESLPDNTEVVKPVFDHQYARIDASVGEALFDAELNQFHEDYGESVTPEDEFGKRVKVLIIH